MAQVLVVGPLALATRGPDSFLLAWRELCRWQDGEVWKTLPRLVAECRLRGPKGLRRWGWPGYRARAHGRKGARQDERQPRALCPCREDRDAGCWWPGEILTRPLWPGDRIPNARLRFRPPDGFRQSQQVHNPLGQTLLAQHELLRLHRHAQEQDAGNPRFASADCQRPSGR